MRRPASILAVALALAALATLPAGAAAAPSLEPYRGLGTWVDVYDWSATYNHWLENIQDWCISRQLWWGHQIPAWYDEAGKVYVARDE